MVRDIDVDLVRDPNRTEVTAFQIAYTAANPSVAQQVTEELKDTFISENNKVRQQESQGTTTFFEKQLEDARQNLADQEAKVREFEGMHEGALPTQQSSNLAILSGLQSQLQSDEDALGTAKQQRVYLRRCWSSRNPRLVRCVLSVVLEQLLPRQLIYRQSTHNWQDCNLISKI
jgi:hypothetical protein